jgi:glycosyltransferase A (GT-A) superfamily protein (DUF2064 family)
MIQTALWLPRGMHERLKKAGGERGLGNEIRRLLEASLDAAETPKDKNTSELVAQIEDIAADLSRVQPWHTDRFAFDVFKAAINTLLSRLQPGEANPETKDHFVHVWEEDNPETIGRMIARLVQIDHARERIWTERLKG